MSVAEMAEAGAALTTEPDADEPTSSRRGRSRLEALGPIAVFVVFIGFWYFMSYVGIEKIFGKPSFLVPPPHTVIKEGFLDATARSQILSSAWLSLRVAIAGLLIAIVLGMSLAIVMSQARWIERSIYPYMVALQAIPILAFVPLIGSILGFTFRSRVLVCVILAIFPIVANTLFGLLSADRGQHDLFTLHGASRWTRLRKLQLPAAMPSIFTGFRISAGLSVIGAIVGDFFFRQGERGLGSQIDVFRSRNQNPEMFAAVIVAALMGIAVFWFFGFLSNRVVGSWHEQTRRT